MKNTPNINSNLANIQSQQSAKDKKTLSKIAIYSIFGIFILLSIINFFLIKPLFPNIGTDVLTIVSIITVSVFVASFEIHFFIQSIRLFNAAKKYFNNIHTKPTIDHKSIIKDRRYITTLLVRLVFLLTVILIGFFSYSYIMLESGNPLPSDIFILLGNIIIYIIFVIVLITLITAIRFLIIMFKEMKNDTN